LILFPQIGHNDVQPGDIKESIIDRTWTFKISPNPSFSKRGIPPFGKGRVGGISSPVSI
jgi:hypothetical protein